MLMSDDLRMFIFIDSRGYDAIMERYDSGEYEGNYF